jgi:two-component sensor histidine kinase
MEFINRREFYLSTMQNENQKILDDVTDILEERVKKSTEKLRRKNEELIKEIEERKKIEEKMNQSLKEKDVLLKEIHHRVKNNMQIISSMLLLQSRYSNNENVKNILLESQNRIESMALVHEKLYQSDNLSSINFKQYVDSLAKNILTLYNRRSTVMYNIECEDELNLTINTAIPLGLLISELMTNSVKHAFKNIEKGIIKICLQKVKNDNKLQLTYFNDGNPFPENININNPNLKTYGLRLISILTSQLDGTIDLKRENGTTFVITFSMI